MDISNDIKESIEKNLPHAVGETLRKRLEQADRDANTVKMLNERITADSVTIASLNGQLNQLRADLGKHSDLATREQAVAERERQAENAALKVQLAAAVGNMEFARGVAMGLVRNTEFKQDVFTSSNNRALPVPQGGMVQHAYSTESTSVSETKTAT